MSRSDLIPPSPSDADYAKRASEQGDIAAGDDPLALFAAWFSDAKDAEPDNPNAMSLATVDDAGLPDVRIVLLKDFDARGFVFYSNAESAKGVQLATNPKAALCFHWKSLNRQVRLRGPVAPVSADDADAYFASRARDARIGAWASAQSRPVESREALEKAISEKASDFAGQDVSRPDYWTGFRLTPLAIEFWRDRLFRLHDRIQFIRDGADTGWSKRRLYP